MNNISTLEATLNGEKDKIKDELTSCWGKIVKGISKDKKFHGAKESLEWLEVVLESNVPFGKQNRALASMWTYRHLVPNYTPHQNFKACVAAWCSEIMQAASLMADDIMDSASTRRGRPCWYLRKDLGANRTALNDCFMLENFVYYILRKYIGEDEFYHRLVYLTHETALQTIFGQYMDLKLEMTSRKFDSYNMDRYSVMVQYKTSYYTFYSPIAAAMIMAGETDKSVFSVVEDVTLKMGFYFQVQDDYLDCYGNPEMTGKIGTDIQSRKCTWLLVKALELASESQRSKLEAYFQDETSDENTEKIKEIYLELEIPKVYENFEKEQQILLKTLIEELPKEIPKFPFQVYASIIFGRTK